jgi:hypothetical protein
MEEYIPWLKNAAVSYLNIDVAVSGPIPDVSATPDLHNIATTLMNKIVYPYRNETSLTMYDVWSHESGEVGVLGSGSDYTAFLHRGIASIDMGAGGGPNDPVVGVPVRITCETYTDLILLYLVSLPQQLRLVPLDVHLRRPRFRHPQSHGPIPHSPLVPHGIRPRPTPRTSRLRLGTKHVPRSSRDGDQQQQLHY